MHRSLSKNWADYLKKVFTNILENMVFIGGVCLNNRQETPEGKRESLRHKELKKNPNSVFGDGLNRAENGNLADLVGALGWKVTGIIIVVLIVGYVLYKLIF